MDKFFERLDESPTAHQIWNIVWTLAFFAFLSGVMGLQIENKLLVAGIAAVVVYFWRMLLGRLFRSDELLTFIWWRESITIAVAVAVYLIFNR